MGSGFWFGLLFLVLHLALCGALWLLARSRALEVEGYFLPVALLVPVCGPLCVVLLHTSHRLTGGQLLDRTLKKLRINEEIYKISSWWKTRRKIPSSRWKRPCW